MTINMNDRAVIASSSLGKRTQDGYLAVFAKVARTGIQQYNGREVGRPDLERVRVYRPESEVFKRDTMRSLAHRPMTSDHPPVMVTDKNWKDYAVGHTLDEIVRDGHFVKVPILMMDGGVINRIESGERELSVGYTCDIKWESGVSPQGDEYDAIQHNIRANHIAVVRAARGGSDLRIGDALTCPECGKGMSETAKKCPACGHEVKDSNNEGDYQMKKFVIDGISVEMSERDAEVVQKHVSVLEKTAKDAQFETAEEKKKRLEEEAKFKSDSAAATTQLVSKDKEIETLKKALTDAAITPIKLDELVKARAVVVDKAKELLGDKLVVDGKSDHEIRKQVVDAHVGDVAAGWDEKQIAASFASIKIDGANIGDGTTEIVRSFSGKQVMGDARANAYKERDEALTNAWMK